MVPCALTFSMAFPRCHGISGPSGLPDFVGYLLYRLPQIGTYNKIHFVQQLWWVSRANVAGSSASRSFVTCIQSIGCTGVTSNLKWGKDPIVSKLTRVLQDLVPQRLWNRGPQWLAGWWLESVSGSLPHGSYQHDSLFSQSMQAETAIGQMFG